MYGGTSVAHDTLTPPPAWRYDYDAYGLTFFTTYVNNADSSTIFEIHISENVSKVPSSLVKKSVYKKKTNVRLNSYKINYKE